MCRGGRRLPVAAGAVLVALLLAHAAPHAHARMPGAAPPPGAGAPEEVVLTYGEEESEWRGKVVRLSWRPRAFLWKNFLTEAECDHLVTMSRASLTKSTVVDTDTGKPMDSDVRTSSGTFYQRGHDDIISKIEERVAAASMMPVENQEGLQLLHYQDGEKYEPHTDWFREKFNQDDLHGGQRYITVLMYLSTPEEGGETVFPMAEFKSTGDDLSECAKKGLANKPYKGDALMFYSLTPDGKEDELSMHGSCPTLKGEKWSATKWIHVAPYGGTAAEQKAKWGDCIDTNPQCPGWAERGECATNPKFMLSGCRLSCGKCTPKKKKAAAAQQAT
ncbi:MAG: hypothetical protein J3K34DRAFT_381121 [Monoraphidium minutum]|nr:MAG: hypothetical protein J3K34DRAFT_381121 [Monoraphidium minutum]